MQNENIEEIKKKLNIINRKVYEQKLIQCYQSFADYSPILIKGWAIAKYYSNPFEREIGDIDLAVLPEKYKKSLEIKVSLNLSIVDLHRGLRHLDTVPWENLFENSQIIKLDNVDIRVLRPEDHLRVICVHWLTDGGECLEKLRDVYWLITNRPENFDWDRCLTIVSKRRRRWILCTIGLAHKYLGLDLSGTPIEEEAKDLPEWLTKRVEKEWNSGIRLIPLSSAKRNYKVFLRQVWKRLPPNPITATIDCEGDFDARTRIFYQIRDIFKRIKIRKMDNG